MKRPTIEDVQQYCSERQNDIDAERWFDYYESCGWVIGKSRKPMKNWQAAIRTWERDKLKVDPKGIIQRARDVSWATDLFH